MLYTLSISVVWTDFEACSLSDLLSANVVFKKGNMQMNRAKGLVVSFDLNAYHAKRVAEAAAEEAKAAVAAEQQEINDDDDIMLDFDPKSIENVAMRCPDFANVKSMLETLVVENADHLLQLSPK